MSKAFWRGEKSFSIFCSTEGNKVPHSGKHLKDFVRPHKVCSILQHPRSNIDHASHNSWKCTRMERTLRRFVSWSGLCFLGVTAARVVQSRAWWEKVFFLYLFFFSYFVSFSATFANFIDGKRRKIKAAGRPKLNPPVLIVYESLKGMKMH